MLNSTGFKLLPYLNKEMLNIGQVALKKDVDKVREELHDFKKEIRDLLKPPVTDEKLEKARHLSLVEG